MKYINVARNNIKKKFKRKENIIDNKLINGIYILLKNDLVIRDLFKINIYKKEVIKYNINIIKKIKPIGILCIFYKNCLRYE